MAGDAVAIAGLLVMLPTNVAGVACQCFRGCFAGLLRLLSNIGTGCANKKGLTYWHDSCL